jgi:hypothetical protein
LVKKHLGQRDSSTLAAALEQFYHEHREFVERNMRSSVTALSDAIRTELENELDISLAGNEEYEHFIAEYLSAYAARSTESSRRQLQAVIDDAAANSRPVDEAIQTRLDEWTEKRPDKESRNETTRTANAVTRAVFAIAGVTNLVWRNMGDSCEVCKGLNGRVVGIDKPFASAGSVLAGGFSVNRNTSHPPIHRGCACVIDRA